MGAHQELAGFREELAVIEEASESTGQTTRDELEELYLALVLGLRDYFSKCGFKSALLGLSGGIDSALTALWPWRRLARECDRGDYAWPYSSDGALQMPYHLRKPLYQVSKNTDHEIF